MYMLYLAIDMLALAHICLPDIPILFFFLVPTVLAQDATALGATLCIHALSGTATRGRIHLRYPYLVPLLREWRRSPLRACLSNEGARSGASNKCLSFQ